MDRKKALNLLGLAYRAKKVVCGEENVLMNLRSGKCKVVLVASDASSRTIDNFQRKCFFYNAPLVLEFNCEELSKSLGKGMVKIITLTDDGFCKAFLENLK